MKVLQDNLLEMYTEELEILDFKLQRLHEQAFGAEPVAEIETAESPFSLLEGFTESEAHAADSGELVILNEEAYELYTEALGTSLRNIWKAIIRMIKSIFISSGNKMSGKEVHTIVNMLKEAAEDGKLDAPSLKNAVQKGFYLIAGLGNSVDGAAVKAAYDNGTVVDFVTRNIQKVNLAKIAEDSKFRICIGTYESNIKNSMALTGAVFSAMAKGGVNNLKATLKGKPKNEAADAEFEADHAEFFEAVEAFQKYFEEGEPDGDGGAAPEEGSATKKSLKDRAAEIGGAVKEKAGQVGDWVKGLPADIKAFFQRLWSDIQGLYTKGVNGVKSVPSNVKSAFDKFKSDVEEFGKKCQSAWEGRPKNFAEFKAKTKEMADSALATIQGLPEKVMSSIKAMFHKDYWTVQKAVGAVVAAGAATGAVLLVINLVKKAKAKGAYGKPDDHIAMATITFVNENSANAMAKIRLYGTVSNKISNYDIKGRENVMALQNDLVALVEELSMNGDKIGSGEQEMLREFGSQINSLFAGLTTKPAAA